jgi:hypothetical protein
MKREYILTLLTSLLTIQLTLAQNQILDNIIGSTSQAISSIFAPIFGAGFGEFLFAKILLFFLIFAIVFVALKNIELFDDNKPVHIVLTTVTSILAVRYLRPGEFLNALLLPYTALGGALITLLPLIIFFYFVRTSGIGPFGRRAAWGIYAIFFIMLWGTRQFSSSGTINWIYSIGIAFIIINLIFDKSIQAYFGRGDIEAHKQQIRNKIIAKYETELEEIAENNSKHARKRKKYLNRELRRLNSGRI